MAPAGQVWATITDLATYATFLGNGHSEVLSVEELDRAYAPASGSPARMSAEVSGSGSPAVMKVTRAARPSFFRAEKRRSIRVSVMPWNCR